MLDVDALSKALFSVYDSKDADGNGVASTDGSKAFAQGFINMMTQGKMSSIIEGKGNANGVPFPGSPWSFLGKSVKGNFVGLVPATLANELQRAIPKGESKLMLKEATSLAKYFSSQVNIEFGQGKVVGICTAATGSPPTGGPLTAGQATGGKVTGANGAVLAAQISSDMGVPMTEGMVKMYNALCDYVTKNIELSFPVGQVNGVFPPPPPNPIPFNGIGSGGIIR